MIKRVVFFLSSIWCSTQQSLLASCFFVSLVFPCLDSRISETTYLNLSTQEFIIVLSSVYAYVVFLLLISSHSSHQPCYYSLSLLSFIVVLI